MVNFESDKVAKQADTSGKRYSRPMMDKLFGKGARMEPVDVGIRKNMAAKERALAETNPGPLNKEPWAGWQKPGHENYRP